MASSSCIATCGAVWTVDGRRKEGRKGSGPPSDEATLNTSFVALNSTRGKGFSLLVTSIHPTISLGEEALFVVCMQGKRNASSRGRTEWSWY